MTSHDRQDWHDVLDEMAREDEQLNVPDGVFERVMAEWSVPRAATARIARLRALPGRIRERLRAQGESASRAALPSAGASGVRYAWRTGLLLAAATAVIVVVATAPWQHGVSLATVEAADGSTYALGPDVVLRSSDAGGTMLTLMDGSRVEMRSQSALSLERAADGIGIRLRTGSLIVDAAKRPDGHLYVHTKDMTVAVVGTMFAVNTEDLGSSLTVIEGKVRVRERGAETTLERGDQISTNPALARRPIREEVGWSRHADAIVAAFTRGMTETAGPLTRLAEKTNAFPAAVVQAQEPGPVFEEASIKPCAPGQLPPAPEGARGGGANSFQMTPGRLRALCTTVATLIRIAYGYSPAALDFNPNAGGLRAMDLGTVYGVGQEDGRRVRGGPDWVRSEMYTVEAIAGAGVTPNPETMRGVMLQRLLERRAQLKVHIEAEQVPAFALTVAKGGQKIKPVAAGACDLLPGREGSPLLFGFPGSVLTPPRQVADVRGGAKPSCGSWGHRNGPNWVFLGGEVPIEALVRTLAMRLGGVRVEDRTGITDRYNIVFEFANDENTPGLPGGDLPAPPDPGDIPRAATIFTALEEQLGLRLEPTRASREFIVIDHVERPSPN